MPCHAIHHPPRRCRLGAAVLTTAAVGGAASPRTSRAPSMSTARRPWRPSRWPSRRTSPPSTRASASGSARKAPATASRSSSASTAATSRDASRTIHEDEAALCAENGVEYAELKIGYDGLAVITSPENPIECLNKYDLWALFGAESNDITTWQDAEAFAHSSWARRPTSPRATSPSRPRAPSRAPMTPSSSWRSVAVAEERGVEAATRDPVPPTYVGAANDLRHHPGRLAVPDLHRLRRPLLRRRTPAMPSRSSPSTRVKAASRPAPRPSRTAPTP